MNIYVSEQTHGLGIYVVYKLTDSKNKIRKLLLLAQESLIHIPKAQPNVQPIII